MKKILDQCSLPHAPIGNNVILRVVFLAEVASTSMVISAILAWFGPDFFSTMHTRGLVLLFVTLGLLFGQVQAYALKKVVRHIRREMLAERCYKV